MQEFNFKLALRNRLIVGLTVATLIALVHVFRVGSYLEGNLHALYYSYVSDLLIPFAAYYLLCINDLTIQIFRKWYVKAAIIIGLTALLEMLQLFGVYALGVTFDPLDFVAYAAGVGLAVVFDRILFKRYIPCWDLSELL